MAKTVAPGKLDLPGGGSFIANAMPDPFDGRDFEYRPRLRLLPATLDQRFPDRTNLVLAQDGSSCTGHAVATVLFAGLLGWLGAHLSLRRHLD